MKTSNEEETARVLIVDADESEARWTAAVCSGAGFEALTASGSQAALEKYLEALPVLVLVEASFADGPGLELIQQIRGYDWTDQTVVLVHTKVEGSKEELVEDVMLAGADGIVPKPLDLDDLARFIVLPNPTEDNDDSGVDFDPLADETEGVGREIGGGELTMQLSDFERDRHLMMAADGDVEQTLDIAPASRTSEDSEPAGDIFEGDLGRPTLLDLLSAASCKTWDGRLRVQVGDSRRCEFSIVGRRVRSVIARGIGPSVVDVAYRSGWVDPKKVGSLRLDILEQGELAAHDILIRADLDDDAVERVFYLTAHERIMAAGAVAQGVFACLPGAKAHNETFDVDIPIIELIAAAVDRQLSVDTILDRYTDRDEDGIQRTQIFEQFESDFWEDRFTRTAFESLVDGIKLLDWLQMNRAEPGKCFVLLAKLEACGAIELGGDPLVKRVRLPARVKAGGMNDWISLDLLSPDKAEGFDGGSETKTFDLMSLSAHMEELDVVELDHPTGSMPSTRQFAAEVLRDFMDGSPTQMAEQPGPTSDPLAETSGSSPGEWDFWAEDDDRDESSLVGAEPLDADDLSVEESPDDDDVFLRATAETDRAEKSLESEWEKWADDEEEFDEEVELDQPPNEDETSVWSDSDLPAPTKRVSESDDDSSPGWGQWPDSKFAASPDEEEEPEDGSATEMAQTDAMLSSYLKSDVGKPEPMPQQGTAVRPSSLSITGSIRKLGPPNRRWREDFISALLRGDFGAAESEIHNRTGHRPQDLEAVCYLHWLRFAQGHEASHDAEAEYAINQLESAFQENPTAPLPCFLIGLTAISQNDLSKARKHFRHAVALSPQESLFHAADALTKAGYFSHPRADLSASEVIRVVFSALERS